jgi:hypothetical protein
LDSPERHPLHWDARLGGEDDENWKLVLFIRHLPKLTHEELELMREVNTEKADH